MTPGRLAGKALWITGLTVLAAFGSVSAQEEVDSTRLRVIQRLERLARAPGFDSVLFVQDSMRVAEIEAGRGFGGAASADSVVAELMAMPGFTLTEYDGGSATFEAAERILTLIAPDGARARVSSEGMSVEADSSILYNEETGRLQTVGQSTFTPDIGDPIESASLVFDISEERGSAFGAQTSYSEGGANWLVTGDMPFAAADSSFMSHARFTSCDLEEPHYHFETDEIKIVGGKVLVARPVRLYFADVPVAWLPFVAQSLSQGRSSGLLTPRFSVNDIVRTSGRYRRRVSNLGFYWAMSDYSDALMAVDWFSQNFLSLTSSLRYSFNRQFLDGDLSFRRYWRADGSTELALDTRHNWDLDERTKLRMSGRYVSSNDFVRENSFNPAEVTQSIDSEGGINRRFNWGTASMGANRKQYLSDDRTEWTLPSANLSLSTITLFRNASSNAHFYNNMTWSGSASFSRRTLDRVQPDVFSFSHANTETTAGSVRSTLSLGNLSLAQSVQLRQSGTLGVPDALLVIRESENPTLITGSPVQDITDSHLTWQSSVSYQQQLIGSTTITPRLAISGNMFRSDTSAVASALVSAPSRVSFGGTLKTDIYGFYGGFGGFEAVRHKISPSLQYEWSPATSPTQLQQQLFRSRTLQPKNALSLTLNQTWEAKRRPPEGDSTAANSSTVLDSLNLTSSVQPTPSDGPTRLQQGQTVSLLALRTSVLRYDFVEADSIGTFLAGFETTRLSNQISSDFLRGLTISVDHDLFEDKEVEGQLNRNFAPHLAQVNLGFSLGSSSSIFRWLGFLSGGEEGESPGTQTEEPDVVDPFEPTGVNDESSIIPTGRRPLSSAEPARRGDRGGWNANLSYSLQRPRGDDVMMSQMLTGTITLRPTENWDLSWRTAYDLERRAFNDHTIRLSRDLHRWEANFDFLQTATGNWTFRFEVSLIDNRDLKFDYKQRNLDIGLPRGAQR
ncbi:MAG TPA: LPS-assembly protein LptD [Gemmatimonadetes bacterium]|nr:LPS-assembly protein LptD [Gemmatimonadota bacterium]